MSDFAIFSGHSQLKNNSYTGAMGNMKNGEINETLSNEDVAKAVDKWLEIGGATSDLFIIPRKQLSSKSLEDDYKLPKANAKNYKCIVEIHFNAFQDADNPMGTECLYNSSKGKVYAQNVNDRLDDIFKDRQVAFRDNLYMLTKTKSPAIIVEVCFCDSKADCDLYNKYGADHIGKLIAEGLLNKKITSNAKPSNYVVKVTTDTLNRREGASTNYRVIGTLKKGDVYTIIEEKDGWGKLKYDLGWISLKYTKIL